MKITYPTTHDGWLKLGNLIFAKSENLGDEPAINPADADPKKVGTLASTAAKKLATGAQLHKDAETSNEAGEKDITEMESEIRRVAKVLTGRNQKNPKATGVWGFTMDESSGTPPPVPPVAK
ncbi:MAG: hypothetical protein HY841_05965 [Bacteroidetes bacterium]|nr:hypothetical protein [Bacteroidota bacterium]